MSKLHYVLGDKAESFSDTQSGLVIVKNHIGAIDHESLTPQVIKAAASGHIKQVSEEEANRLVKKGSHKFYKNNVESKVEPVKVKNLSEADIKAVNDELDEEENNNDDDDEPTKSEMIDYLKEQDLPDDVKKKLTKMKTDELTDLYRKNKK